MRTARIMTRLVMTVFLLACAVPVHAEGSKYTPKQIEQADHALNAWYAARWINEDYLRDWCNPEARNAQQKAWAEWKAKIEQTKEAQIARAEWEEIKAYMERAHYNTTEQCYKKQLAQEREKYAMTKQESPAQPVQTDPLTMHEQEAEQWLITEADAFFTRKRVKLPDPPCTEEEGVIVWRIWDAFVKTLDETPQGKLRPKFLAGLQRVGSDHLIQITAACAKRKLLWWEQNYHHPERRMANAFSAGATGYLITINGGDLYFEDEAAEARYRAAKAEEPLRVQKELLDETRRHNQEMEYQQQQALLQQQMDASSARLERLFRQSPPTNSTRPQYDSDQYTAPSIPWPQQPLIMPMNPVNPYSPMNPFTSPVTPMNPLHPYTPMNR